jgi:hypothetical protein
VDPTVTEWYWQISQTCRISPWWPLWLYL